MAQQTIRRTSLFPARRKEVFSRLTRYDTLQYIASPYATFESVERVGQLVWEPGRTFAFRFKMFGIISLGIHRIQVVDFCQESICTKEGNPFCPMWNHRIILREVDRAHTEYTDEVEINAGWKTPLVALWAKAFYRHRQKRWIKLLRAI